MIWDDNIKVKFSEGDKVVLPSSKDGNIATVTHAYGDGFVLVDWGNGTDGCYYEDDLISICQKNYIDFLEKIEDRLDG